jgi:hypothetical protein
MKLTGIYKTLSMQEVLLLKWRYIFESNNSAGGISRVSTTTNRVALENSNAQSQLGSSIASVLVV